MAHTASAASDVVDRATIAARTARVAGVAAVVSVGDAKAVEDRLPAVAGDAGDVALKDAGAASLDPAVRAVGASSAAGDLTLNLDAQIRQVGAARPVILGRRVRETAMAVPEPRVPAPLRPARVVDTLAGQGSGRVSATGALAVPQVVPSRVGLSLTAGIGEHKEGLTAAALRVVASRADTQRGVIGGAARGANV